VSPDIPSGLLMDETRLRQVLFNVVGNAVKFTDHGMVTLSVRNLLSDKDTRQINLIFEITDTGMGIDPDQLEHIFNPFEQQKGQGNKYGGTGLGLAITKRLTEMMNGNISVVSQMGKGTCFTIELRAVEVSSVITEKQSATVQISDPLDFEGATILLVEDNRYNIELIKAILEPMNIRMIEALNGKQAIDSLKEFRPDLILMDMKMPVMNGYEATRLIKSDEELKEIPIIALTADVMQENRERIMGLGCNAFLAKPVDENNLFLALMKFLPHHTQTDHNLTVLQSDAGLSSEKEKMPNHFEPSQEDTVAILKCLSTKLMQEWDQIADSMILSRWSEFGSKIKELGEKYHENLLVDYGNSILHDSEQFNIMKLKQTIQRYPEFVSDIRKQYRTEKTSEVEV
jgi:two-component system sensor histidine kinase EvgS